MDRDKRWERTQKAYDLLMQGIASFTANNAIQAIELAYSRGETDEFVQPTLIDPAGIIHDGDGILFMNFRADRARQLTHTLLDPDFNHFNRRITPKISHFMSMTQYAANLPTEVIFPIKQLKNVLGSYLAEQGLRQFRIAETEKYAHITFFLNGGLESPFPGEDRVLIPSPKIATYDLQPEMSAIPVTEQLCTAIVSQKYDFIVVNFANPDMLGHTGIFNAAVHAIETIDTCLNKIIKSLQKVGGEAIITADHGNAECMFDEQTQQPHTAHTQELVPFLYVGRRAMIIKQKGILADIAPSILYLMGLPKPAEMSGEPLVKLNI